MGFGENCFPEVVTVSEGNRFLVVFTEYLCKRKEELIKYTRVATFPPKNFTVQSFTTETTKGVKISK